MRGPLLRNRVFANAIKLKLRLGLTPVPGVPPRKGVADTCREGTQSYEDRDWRHVAKPTHPCSPQKLGESGRTLPGP